MTLLLAFLIGFFAGLRSLTPPAATAWAAYLGWLKLERPLSLVGSAPAVADSHAARRPGAGGR